MIFAAVTYHMFMNHQLKLKYVIDLFLYEYHNLVYMTTVTHFTPTKRLNAQHLVEY